MNIFLKQIHSLDTTEIKEYVIDNKQNILEEYQLLRNTIYDSLGVHDLIRNFERENIPLAVMVFDHDWHIRNIGNYKDLKTGFSFNSSLIKDPKSIIDEVEISSKFKRKSLFKEDEI